MDATIQLEGPRKRVAFAVSVALHAGLLLLLLLLKIVAPDPPFKTGGGEGMELGIADIGYDLEGMGDTESMEESSASSESSAPPPEGSDEQLITEDDGEAIETPPEKTENPRAVTPVTTPTKKPPRISEPTVDRRLTDAINSLNTPGEPKPGKGDKPGDPGNPNGIPGGGGLTQGNGWELRGPGSGGGSGGGRGLAKGPDLSERPDLQNPTWVDVKVIVDRTGKVLRVSIADTGTPDRTIQDVAKRAAMTCRFVALPNGPLEQAHVIRLRFVPS